MNTGRIITTALAAAILAIPAMAADAPGYFKVPGTDTTMKIFGSVNTQAVYEMTGYYGIGHGLHPTNAVSDDTMKSNQWTWRANGDFGFTTTTPSPLGDVTTKLEWNYRDKTNYDNVNGLDEFKNAYVQIGGLLVGRANANFVDGDASPNCIDADGMLSDSWWNPGRMIQIAYTTSFTKQVTGTFAIEQPQNVYTKKVASAPDAFGNSTTTTSLGDADHTFPGDIVAAVSYADSWGHIRGAIAYSQFKAKTDPGVTPNSSQSRSDSYMNWMLSGNLMLGKGNLTAEVRKGVGYYGTGTLDGFTLNNAGTDFDHIAVTCFEAGFSYPVTDVTTVAVGLGQSKWAKDTNVGLNADVKLLQGFVNVQYQLTKTVSIAAEYFYGKLDVDSDGGHVFQQHDGTFTDSAKESRINLQIAASLF
jgi:hypothetical protein